MPGCTPGYVSREQGAVRVDRGLPAEMGVEHGGVGRYLPAADQVDEGGHGLALVDRVGDHALGPRGEPHRVEGGGVRDAVDAGVVALVELDVVVRQLPLDSDEARGLPCDAADLLAGL